MFQNGSSLRRTKWACRNMPHSWRPNCLAASSSVGSWSNNTQKLLCIICKVRAQSGTSRGIGHVCKTFGPQRSKSSVMGNKPYCLTPSLPNSKSTFSQPPKEKCIREKVKIGSRVIFHLSELWKAKFFILCDVIFLMRLQGKFEIDHSWEWKGLKQPRAAVSALFDRTSMPSVVKREYVFNLTMVFFQVYGVVSTPFWSRECWRRSVD